MIDKKYVELVNRILSEGTVKKDRTGTGTISIFGTHIEHDMRKGFPLLSTKKMYFKGVITELLWFLRGDTNIKFLLDNDCHIWDGDCYKNYFTKTTDQTKLSKDDFIQKLKTDDDFCSVWGDLGKIYGYQWRHWTTDSTFEIDQIQKLIDEIKLNPDSRRLIVNAWNPSHLNNMVLPPCHFGFQVYTRELTFDERIEYANNLPIRDKWGKTVLLAGFPEETYQLDNVFNIPKRAISLSWNQRSVDVGLGLPFNIASYALLLEILGVILNMVPDKLIGNLGDTHLYLNHIEPIKEQLNREPFDLPKLVINTEFWLTKTQEFGHELTDNINSLIESIYIEDFQLIDYKSHPIIKLPLSN